MTPPHVTIVNEDTFIDEVMKSDKLVLIDFYADWCGPCKSMAPGLAAFAEENQATVKVVKINIDENRQLAALFQIRSIPTLVTMKDGMPVYVAVGALPKSGIEELVRESFKKINTPPAVTPPANDAAAPKKKTRRSKPPTP